MSKRQHRYRHLSLVTLGGCLAACSLDPELPGRNTNPAPVNHGVTLSGAGAAGDLDPALGYGESSRITDIVDESGSSGTPRVAAPSIQAGDSAGASAEDANSADRAPPASGDGTGGASGAAGTADAAGTSEGGDAAGSGPKEPPVLWFSEYIEGSSSNKALEITARARATLDGCKVSAYFNGKTEATVLASLSGVLDPDRPLTLCTSMLEDTLGVICNQVGNLTFNGDDVVTLSCDGTILDVIGQIGVDPGQAWGDDTCSTADHTLRRKCTIQAGDSLGGDAFDPSTEWQAFPSDTFDGLGTRGCPQ